MQHDTLPYTIRRATPSDLDAAARLRAVSWQQSFADFLPASTLEGFVESPWTRFVADEWRALLAAGTGEVWVAEDADGVLVGVAQAEADDAPDAPAPVKLSKLYLLDRAKGTGLAVRLMQRTIGDGPAYLWVLDGNDRGRRFYERHGFVADGTFVHLLDDLAHIREIRMVRAGTSSATPGTPGPA